jgi:hypothetical protein
MAVTLGADVLARYRRFSLHNSPYVAHDRGHAVDLYPGDETVDAGRAPSPVAGEILETKSVRAPSRPYAADRDHLILVDTGERVARLLHVDPEVEAGERVAVGDPMGELVRAGFFAPWVPEHVHLEFRRHDANPYRASGSCRLELGAGVDLRPVAWDGAGTVAAAGGTWALLDAPAHPAPGEAFAGVAADPGGGVLDGGCPHYGGGGVLGSGGDGGPVSLAGTVVVDADGRAVTWRDVTVRANGRAVAGVSLFCGRERAGVKLVGDGVDLAAGERVRVRVEGND